MIPDISSLKERFFKNKINKPQQRDKEHDRETLLENFSASTSFAESYRTLRTNLFFTAIEKELKSVVITSSVEGEGKTTTCVNLAYTIAQTNKKVLLMDFDMRRPHLSSLYDLRDQNGLSNIVRETYSTHLTQGSLSEFSINDLIQMVKLQNRTCCLNVKNDETFLKFFFDKGHINDIFWESRVGDKNDKKFINILIQDNLLTEKEADMALGHLKKSALQFGNILYTMGFLSKDNISRALSMYTIEAVRAASAMEDGSFEFSSQDTEESKKYLNLDIDFDKLYSEFTISTEDYWGNFLKKNINEAIRKTNTANLYIMPSGIVPPNPSEVVGSELITYLIDYLKNEFDFIIIDTPPVIAASDALLMAPRTDGTILVIKAGHADRKIIQSAVEQYNTAKQNIIGVILNKVNIKKDGYYRYYKQYYSSYYGQQQ